jgi:hypothetical protein
MRGNTRSWSEELISLPPDRPNDFLQAFTNNLPKSVGLEMMKYKYKYDHIFIRK